MVDENIPIQETPKVEYKNLVTSPDVDRLRLYSYKFKRNPFSVVGLALVCLCLLFAVFAEMLAPYPDHITGFVDFSKARIPPCAAHWFGTDMYGRDVLSRVLYCFRGAIVMGGVVLAISVPIGTTMGLLAGYHKGTWVETVIMRITDVFLSIPPLVLALSIAAMITRGLMGAMVAVTTTWWTWYCRMVYGNAISISEEYFVKYAELTGASKGHILWREIFPSTLTTILTKAALDFGFVILLGASLSYAGLGEQPPTPAFGTMISEGAKFLPDIWWATLFPALGIVFCILGFNFTGDGIRDMLGRGRG